MSRTLFTDRNNDISKFKKEQLEILLGTIIQARIIFLVSYRSGICKYILTPT